MDNLPEQLRKNLEAQGIRRLTVDQLEIIRCLRSKVRTMFSAHEGAGKLTALMAAFAAEAMTSSRALAKGRRPQHLLITNHAEDAVNAAALFEKFTAGTGLKGAGVSIGRTVPRNYEIDAGLDFAAGPVDYLEETLERSGLDLSVLKTAAVYGIDEFLENTALWKRLVAVAPKMEARRGLVFTMDYRHPEVERDVAAFFPGTRIVRLEGRWREPEIFEDFRLVSGRGRKPEILSLIENAEHDGHALVVATKRRAAELLDLLVERGWTAPGSLGILTPDDGVEYWEKVKTLKAVVATETIAKLFPDGSFDQVIFADPPTSAAQYERCLVKAVFAPSAGRPRFGHSTVLYVKSQIDEFEMLRTEVGSSSWRLSNVHEQKLSAGFEDYVDHGESAEGRKAACLEMLKRRLPDLEALLGSKADAQKADEATPAQVPAAAEKPAAEEAQPEQHLFELETAGGALEAYAQDLQVSQVEEVPTEEAEPALSAPAETAVAGLQTTDSVPASETVEMSNGLEAPQEAAEQNEPLQGSLVEAEMPEEPAEAQPAVVEDDQEASEAASEDALEEVEETDADEISEASEAIEEDNQTSGEPEEAEEAEGAEEEPEGDAGEEIDEEADEDSDEASEDEEDDFSWIEEAYGVDAEDSEESDEYEDDVDYDDDSEDEASDDDDAEALEEAPQRRTLTIRAGYVPHKRKDQEPSVTITEPLSSNTVELRAAQARMRREMKSNGRMTHQMVGKRGTIRRDKQRKDQPMGEVEGILSAVQPVKRKKPGTFVKKKTQGGFVQNKDGKFAGKKQDFQKPFKKKKPFQGEQPPRLPAEENRDALLLPMSAPAAPAGLLPPPDQMESKQERPKKEFRKGRSLRAAMLKRREEREAARAKAQALGETQAPASAAGGDIPPSANFGFPGEGSNAQPAAVVQSADAASNPAAGNAPEAEKPFAKKKPWNNKKFKKPFRKKTPEQMGGDEVDPFNRADPAERSNFPRDDMDDDNFGNSIHYRMKSERKPEVMPWQTASAYGAEDRPATLSFAQTMPGAADRTGLHTVFGGGSDRSAAPKPKFNKPKFVKNGSKNNGNKNGGGKKPNHANNGQKNFSQKKFVKRPKSQNPKKSVYKRSQGSGGDPMDFED